MNIDINALLGSAARRLAVRPAGWQGLMRRWLQGKEGTLLSCWQD
ncbi:hypothetical protein V8O11_21015 [Erwinia aphidicola]